ncbi:FAD-dependent oxidoreductase, partial [Chromobacterium sphagni]|uniref:FAD-dependent oxidoreductase n=1 Tax=Chromobacterium sphagni TaxID=1903179 RepID=UPI001F4F06B1
GAFGAASSHLSGQGVFRDGAGEKPDCRAYGQHYDEACKLVFSRLGDQLRIAGTAELAGYSSSLNPVRCQALIRRGRALFPDACDWDSARFWSGLRPATPGNVPLIGKSALGRLYLNTGHGTLGWTEGAGSGRALAEIVSGRRPQLDFAFLGL